MPINIRMRPESFNNYADVVHPETNADNIVDKNGKVIMTQEERDKLSALKYDGTPKGIISMWSGAIDDVPVGWVLCNGENGTPNLEDRFIMGAVEDEDLNQVGGENRVTLTEAEMPRHTHDVTIHLGGGHSHTYNDAAGNSGALTGGNRTLKTPIGASTGFAGNHNHTATILMAGNSQPHENRPAYYTLAFVMKL